MVGDGSTKSRSNPLLEDCQGEGVKGVVAITGELRGKGLSSNLRCLYCYLQYNDVNQEAISWFHANQYAYCTLISHFIEYVAINWQKIVDNISSQFNSERGVIGNIINEKRLVDCAVTLGLTADILGGFMAEYCHMTDDFVNVMIGEMRKATVQNVLQSELIVQEEPLSIQFIRNIYTLMCCGKIVLHNEKLQSAQLATYTGFEDENYYYFLPEPTYVEASKLMSQTGDYLPYDLNELVKSLCEDNISVSSPNGKGKKTYYSRIDIGNGKKYNFLKIKKSVFYNILEGNFDKNLIKGEENHAK